jgi:hypothetical protein
MLNMLINVYKIYTGPLSGEAQYSRLGPISSSFCYNGSLVTCTVVCLTAAKFKLFVLSLSSMTLFPAYNISARTTLKHRSSCMRNRCNGNVFTETLPRNGPGISALLAVVAYQRLYTVH